LSDAERISIIPGTDAAFLLSLAHVIVEERLYDETFLKYYSNAPFLVKPDGKPLTEADLVKKGDARIVHYQLIALTPAGTPMRLSYTLGSMKS